MSISMLHHVQEWLIWLTIPAALGFPFWYHLRVRWARSPIGRHVMAYSSVVALLYLTSLLTYVHLPLIVLMWVSVVITALMMVVVWWRVVIFVWIYRHAHRRRITEENGHVSVDS